MKKLFSLVLCLCLIFPNVVFANEDDTVTLSDVLNAKQEETIRIQLSFDGEQTIISDAKEIDEFFEICSKTVLEKRTLSETAGFDGLYIDVIDADNKFTGFAYITNDGYADKYTMAMSRLPAKAYAFENAEAANRVITEIMNLADNEHFVCSDWAREYIAHAEKRGFDSFIDYRVPASRLCFCEMLYENIKTMQKKGSNILKDADNTESLPVDVFSDCDSYAVMYLHDIGVINGTGDKTFLPEATISREEVAAILYRLAKKLNIGRFYESYLLSSYMYADETQMSPWAIEAISQLHTAEIMFGVGNDMFEPKENYTIEQSVVTIMRVDDILENSKSIAETFTDKMNAQMPTDKNYMFSPFSIKMALLMAANGAEGDTKSEILSAFDIADIDAFNAKAKDMTEKYSKTDILKLSIANSIWINNDKTAQSFSKEYKDKIAEYYDGETKNTDNKNAIKDVNSWVNDKTGGKIPTIINNSDFWAMLINAIYFKGAWENEFMEGATEKAEFTDYDGKKTDIDFMNRTAWMNYAQKDGVQIVELPYKNRTDKISADGEYLGTEKYDNLNVSMFILLGNSKINAPETVLKNAELTNTFVKLSIPKFKIEYETNLNELLKNIGIKKAFTDEKVAEFEPMFDSENMFITDTIHKTYIAVDEKGTEAAAVTAIGMAGSAMPPEPISFIADKPFTFVIHDNTNGEILFVGEYAYAK